MVLFSHSDVSIEKMEKLFLCKENHFHVQSFRLRLEQIKMDLNSRAKKEKIIKMITSQFHYLQSYF